MLKLKKYTYDYQIKAWALHAHIHDYLIINGLNLTITKFGKGYANYFHEWNKIKNFKKS